jgi:hypothetical protein
VKRPSPTSPHEGRGQAVKDEESEGAVHGIEPTDTVPANSGRPKAHRQVLTPVLVEAILEHEYRPRGVRRARRPPAQLTVRGGPGRGRSTRGMTAARMKDGKLHPGQGAVVRLPPHCWRTPPQGWRMPFPPNDRGRKGAPTHAEATPHPVRSSVSARMTKILEAEGGAEAAARLASPHQTDHW